MAAALAFIGSINTAQAFCENEQIIIAPITITDPVQCARITNTTIAGDVTNDTTIGNSGPDNTFVIEYSTLTGRFINNGVIVQTGAPGSNITFGTWGSNVAGGIVNNGTINSVTGIGMSIGAIVSAVPVASNQTGAIDNFGIIGGGIAGFDGIAGTLTNTLWNHQGAAITGGTFGILTETTFSQWSGGIVNDGAITGGGNGINLGQLNSVNLTFGGGIRNGVTGSITGTTFSSIVMFNTQFSGGIVNDGAISGGTQGIYVDTTVTFGGGITNTATGTITGNQGSGILSLGRFSGGVDNAGRIQGFGTLALPLGANPFASTNGGLGAFFADSSVGGTWAGTFYNRTTGVFDGTYVGVKMVGTNFNGVFRNAGSILGGDPLDATGYGYGFGAALAYANWTGDIVNEAGATMTARTQHAIVPGYNYFNAGLEIGLLFNPFLADPFAGTTKVTTFLGNVVNAGTIVGPKGVTVLTDSFTGDFTNSGLIATNAPSLATSGAIFFNSRIFQGDFINSGTADGEVDFDVVNWIGNFDNAGRVESFAAGCQDCNIAVDITATNWTGSFFNRAAGVIVEADQAVSIQARNFIGNIDNTGQIGDAGALVGMIVDAASFHGNIFNRAGGVFQGQNLGFGICSEPTECSGFPPSDGVVGTLTNAGRISNTNSDPGSPWAALIIFQNAWTGDIINDTGGLITSPGTALRMAKSGPPLDGFVNTTPMDVFQGNFINRGTIQGGLDFSIANWTGNFDNSGSASGVKFAGAMTGGFFNSGTIVGLDLSGVTSALTYRQTGANSRTGFPFAPMRLSNTAVTTLDFRGGELYGLVIGGNDLNDVFEVNAGSGGEFEYVTGIASNLASFAVNSGTAIIGDTEISNVGSLSVAGGASLYLSNDAVISAGNVTFAPTSKLEAELTPNTALFPSITVSGTASLAGSFVAHIDPMAFAGSGQTQFTYNGLISGPVTGTFSSVTIAGSPSLFKITGFYNSFDVVIERTSLADLGDPESPNQGSVGGALEDIYQDGTSDSDLLNLIDVIAGSSPSEIADIYDAIAGSTQAETQTAALKSDDPWKQSVGQRVNAARSTGCTVAGDTWCFKRYAQAPSPVVTDVPEDPDAFAWLETGLRDVKATSLWGRVVGVWGETDGGISSPGSQQRTYGLIGGADHVVDATLLVGVAGQYVRTTADFDSSRNESLIEAVQGGVYFSYGGADLYVNGNASVIGTRSKTNRYFSVGAIDYNAAVRFPSTSLTGSLEAGKIFEVGGYRLEPNIGLNYASQFTDRYEENGAGGLGLIVDPDDLHSLRSMVGGRLSRVYDLGDRKFVPELRVEWRHEYLDRRHTFQAAFQGAPDATFFVNCEPSARDTFALGTSMTVPLSGRVTGFVDAEGAFSEDARSGTLSLGARATW